MGLFEFLGDNKRENIGTVERDERATVGAEARGVGIKFFVSAVAIVSFECVIAATGSGFIIPNIVLAIYLVASYFIKAKPNTGDLGLLGGLVDHPFKFTDDINRRLFALKILLAPGKFVSRSVVGFTMRLFAPRG